MVVGGVWIILGRGGDALLRLVSSLVLTRLLIPDDFGLVATAALLTTAVEMFSDLGIRQALVQHPKGDSRDFLQTALVMAACRGFVLGLATWLLAGPFAGFFGDERLSDMLRVMAVGAVLRGLSSPGLLVFTRDLAFGRLQRFELACQALRIVVVVTLALAWRNVWALVIGGLLSEILRTCGSFWAAPFRPRFGFSRTFAKDIFSFGRFIMLSTILGYFCVQLDRAYVARHLGMESAGQYYIAVTLAAMLAGAIHEAAGRSLFSGLSRLREDIERLNAEFGHVVRATAALIIPAIVLIAGNSEFIVRILYDDRYQAAGSAMCWLMIAAAVRVWSDIFNAPLIATGHPFPGTLAKAVNLVCVLVLLPVMGAKWGMQGYAFGVMLSTVCGCTVTVMWVHRAGHLRVRQWIGFLGPPATVGGFLFLCHIGAALLFGGAFERGIAVAAVSGVIASVWLWRDRDRWTRLIERILGPLRAVRTEAGVEQ